MRERISPYGLALLFFFIFIFTLKSNAQGTSNKGTDFWVPYAGHVDGTNSRLTLFITSEYAAIVRIQAIGLDSIVTLQPNEAKSIVINPKVYNLYVGTSDGVEVGKAIHVTSDKPVIVYSHISNAARSAACLVYPTNTLGLNYYAISYVQIQDAQNEKRSSQFTIVGVEDGTEIEVTPTQDSRGNSSHKANQPFVITLNTGDVYQYQSQFDLSGSQFRTVNGCKPFSVFSGSSKNGFCEDGNAVNSNNASGQDNLYQQLLPVSAWGKNFVAAPFYNTLNGSWDIYRVQVAEDNTTINVNGSITSANGDMLNNPYKKGDIITFKSQSSTIIKADKPISVAQFQTSQNCNPNNRSRVLFPGDPEMTILNPVEQTLKDVTVYSAVSTPSAPTNIRSHYINIIIKTSGAPTLTVDGESFGTNPEGAAFVVNNFIKINEEYSYIIVDVTQSSNINPTHRIKADIGFVAIAYGYGSFESYGYLAGADLKNLSKFIEPANAVSKEPLTVGCVNSPFNLFLILPYQTTSLKWDLGNGTLVTDPNPTAHFVLQSFNGETLYKYSYVNPTISYNQAGTYAIKAHVVNPNPIACTADEVIELSYEVFDLPVASFEVINPQCKGAEISFIDKSTSGGKSLKRWIWDFGDGTPPEVRLNADPFTHIFTSSGDFQVKLSVESETGCSSATHFNKTVHIKELPVVKTQVTQPNCESQEISFFDKSITAEGSISKWTWDFGDSLSTANNSNLQNPTHVFTKAGKYIVKLTVETDLGCINTLSKEITVGAMPIADFITPDICITDAAADFKNITSISDGSDSNLNFLWNFGDPASGSKNTATTRDATHLYPRDGEFTVTLTVTSNKGCVSTKQKKFTVNGLSPVSEFTANIASVCSGDEVTFEDKSTVSPGKVIRLEWYFDETDHAGNSAYKLVELRPDTVSGRKYVFKYPETHNLTPKLIDVRMRAFSGTLCFSDKTHQITIKGKPAIEFNPIKDVCINDAPFLCKAKEIYGFSGNFRYSGPGVSPNGLFDPQIAGLGTHTITYTFTTVDGCSAEKSQTFTVNPNPVVNVGNDVTILKGGEVKLNAISPNKNMKYKWTPAIGLSNDTIPNPVAIPEKDTKYTVTVYSESGCTAMDDIIVYVRNPDIPNVFSPNGDGVNDKWEIKYIESWGNVDIMVFNRYGQPVYVAKGNYSAWDGTFKGIEVPIGVYYFVISPNNGRKKLAGSITLLR
ncbi:gliding motility-associated C-terminal domain-containing protein [Solitalea lacus]|uniref:gliding motility-associated C-terminal domain-containing protein n=1 Tax=Solitalea lacus TaxID=2911172 RepID=UPI001EDA1C69|nr:gliding motility-associated C-terminal domain-containing protein [Solitalea lacus]UKJ06954.1 PKD domain-containing protein [Solitalea lacus]